MDNLGWRLAYDDRFAFNTLVYIFKYLPVRDLINCARVCSKWKWIVASDILWANLHVYVCEKHYQDVMECHGGNLKNLMLDMHCVKDFEKVCLSDVTKVEKIALTYCHYESLTVLSKYNSKIKQMHIQFMDRFEEEPKVFTSFGHFKNLTHLEILEFSLCGLLKDAKFLNSMHKLEHLALWSRCEEEVWYDVVKQTQLRSLHLYSGDENCMDVMFKNKEIEKLTNLKRLKISNVCFEMIIRQNKTSNNDRYLFTLMKTDPDWFAEENIAIIGTLLNMANQLEVVEWVIGESMYGISFPYSKLADLMGYMDTVKPIVFWPLETGENLLLPYVELETLIHSWMPQIKFSITHMETMAKKTKIPNCVVCDGQKIVQCTYFFDSFFESFTS